MYIQLEEQESETVSQKDYSRLSIAMGDPSSFYAALKKQPETLSPEKALLDLQQKMEKKTKSEGMI